MKQRRQHKPFFSSLRRGLSVCLATALLLGLFPLHLYADAQGEVIEISNYSDLKAQSLFTTEAGGSKNFEGVTLKLTRDIQVPVVTDTSSDSEIAYATCIFGSQENPFKGTFDGNGHTIYGLRYHTVWNEPRADTGLFAATDGAVIQNLTLESADIESDIRGGIVVGYANNTLFSHVTVKNSALKLEAVDNVLLIGTDLGIRGGGIAGQINESTMYDCEVRNCWIRSNNTSGVAALAGKPLALGGLVGCAEGSTIEYSRVIGDTPYDENAPTGTSASDTAGKTLIKIYYDVAVGAIGGNTLYVGGIAGRIWSNDNGDGDTGTAIIDCFSTAEMNYYCATYVSVLGINVGHIGGITAEVWDDNCSITRCHYAGRATSYQYNALLVIPIIQRDVNVSGVADIWRGESDAARAKIYGSFFKASVNAGNERAMTTLGNNLTGEISSNGSFGPWSDTLYTNREAWETFDFDFTGTTPRTSDYDARSGNADGSHVNKWVMDYELGIPVHGSSVAATLDFPGGGTVTIDGTALVGTSVSTTDPYTFAVQGVYANENALTLLYTPTDHQRYRLYGWYRFPDVLDDTAPQSHSYFEQLYETYASLSNVPVYGANGEQISVESVENPVSTDNPYTPLNAENQPIQWQDNDLFTARLQALVRFYDFENHLLDKQTGSADDDLTDDWYFYQDALPSVTPVRAPGDEHTSLLGWTTRVPSAWGDAYSYAATSPALLQDLKNSGEFYEPDTPITKPMELYPVYAGLASNVITQFEGYRYDASGNPVEQSQQNQANRPGVGTTSASVDVSGGATNASVTLSFTGANGGDLPDGYRFLGWYEDGRCISRSASPTLTGVDLTVEHTYLARFEYAVSYMVKSGNWGSLIDSEYKDGKQYTQLWHTFEEPVRQIPGLNFSNETFDHWCTDDYQGSAPVTDQTVVHAPMPVYSHNEKAGIESFADIDLLLDFPGAGTALYDRGLTSYNGEITATPNSGYQFVGWSFENKDYDGENYNTSGTSNPRETGTNTAKDLVYMGHFVADIRFHAMDGTALSTVTRRYQQPLFVGAGTYTYPFYLRPDTLTTVSHTWEAAPSSEGMAKDGYVFLGWADGSGLVNGDGTLTPEGAHLWDRYDEARQFVTSHPDAAALYLLPDDTQVSSTMDLYPVYAQYDISYTTNFEQAGIQATNTYNVPTRPTENTRIPTEGNTYTVSFTVDNSTPVMKQDDSAGLYTVTRVEVVNNTTGDRSDASPSADGSYTVTGLKLGNSYTVIAYYRPMVVIYHLGGATGDSLDISSCAPDTQLGRSPTPLNTAQRVGGSYIFLGWTATSPDTGEPFHQVSQADALPLVDEDTLVQRPMELWPVYIQAVDVQSNIDGTLTSAGQSPTDTRSLTIPNLHVQSGTLTAQEQVTVGSDSHYVFVGWYRQDGTSGSPGTPVTRNTTFTLSGSDLYADGVTYTAVYERAYQITYHGDEPGEIVYTALVSQSQNRSFVTTTQVSDEEGNLTQVTTPIDTEAFLYADRFLSANQVFREWQYVPESGQPQRWAQFCNQTITHNMDLYPVVFAVTVSDRNSLLEPLYRESSSTAPINQRKLEVKVGLGTTHQDSSDVVSSVSVLVMSEYRQDQLTVSVLEQAYAPSGADMKAVEDVPVTLTLRRSADLSLSDSQASRLYGSQTTDSTGNAVFTLTGHLTITKTVSGTDETGSDAPFLISVTLDAQSQTLPIQAGQSLTVTEVPYGISWAVAEQTDWAWRYDPSVSLSQGQLTSYHDSAEVAVTNRQTSSQWFDNWAYAHNVYGTGASGTGLSDAGNP